MQFAAISLILTAIPLIAAGMSNSDGIGSSIKRLRASVPNMEGTVLARAVHRLPQAVATEKVWFSSSSISSNTVCQHYVADIIAESDLRGYYADMRRSD